MKKGVLAMVLLAVVFSGCGAREPVNPTPKDAILYLASAAQAKNEKAMLMAFTPDVRKDMKKDKESASDYFKEVFFDKMGEVTINGTKSSGDTATLLITWRKDGNTTFSFPFAATVKKINGNWLIEKVVREDYIWGWDLHEAKKEEFKIEPLK